MTPRPDIIEDTIMAILSHRKKTGKWPKHLILSSERAAALKTALRTDLALPVTYDGKSPVFMGAQIIAEEKLCYLP